MIIALSVSESEDLGALGMGQMHLQDAMVEIARFLLNKKHKLIYGGDLNYDGAFNFTELLFQLAMTYGGNEIRITNYSVFPLYVKITKKREADLIRVARIERVNASKELDSWLTKRYETASADERNYIDSIITGQHQDSKRIWSENLSFMRRIVTKRIDARIVIGGKLNGHKGDFPGIVEETLLAIEGKVPVFIDGRMGGAALYIIDLIKKNTLQDTFGQSFGGLDGLRIKELAPKRILIEGKNDVRALEKYFAHFLL